MRGVKDFALVYIALFLLSSHFRFLFPIYYSTKTYYLPLLYCYSRPFFFDVTSFSLTLHFIRTLFKYHSIIPPFHENSTLPHQWKIWIFIIFSKFYKYDSWSNWEWILKCNVGKKLSYFDLPHLLRLMVPQINDVVVSNASRVVLGWRVTHLESSWTYPTTSFY